MKNKLVAFALALTTVLPLYADSSARTILYHSKDIVNIRAKVKYTTLIQLPTTEKIIEAATGDKEFWIIDVVGSFCFVHPAKKDIRSNLNLISSNIPHPTALIPFDIIDSDVLQKSLLRLASDIVEYGIDRMSNLQSSRRLLLRLPPSFANSDSFQLLSEKGTLTDAGKRLVRALAREGCVLPIQGPPGTGKTFTAARMIADLMKMGCRVGITAVSHNVISNVLREVCKVTTELGIPFRAIQKSNGNDRCDDPRVTQTDENLAVLNAIKEGTAHLAAGTAWLWARPEMADLIDVLFVDEAGQMSLANALAICQSAKSIVLLGDPQQLEQPQRGIHPPGAEASALGHLLQRSSTLREDQGIFLTETRRLHPQVCSFISDLFYDSRLKSRSENENQRLNC
jgi:uncharacterized protein